MSLTTMIKGKEHRELFKAVAPPKKMFRSLTEDPPFAKAEPRTPGRFQLPESSLIGMAFDYLLRAQVARWAGDSWELTVPWVATYGLESVLTTSYGIEGTPTTHGSFEGLVDSLGRLVPDEIESFYESYWDFTDEEVGVRRRVCDCYQQVHEQWAHYISGGEVPDQEMITAVWFLAKLEDIFRAGGALSELFNRPQMDPVGTLESPSIKVIEDMEVLWKLLRENRRFFTGSESRSYNPDFAEASHFSGWCRCRFARRNDAH